MKDLHSGRLRLATPVHIRRSASAKGFDWNARWHRKQRSQTVANNRSISWWLAQLFAVGSVLFVAGGIAAIAAADRPAAWMNLAGSMAFSIGAVLAVIEARGALRRLGRATTAKSLWSDAGGRAALIQVVAAAGFFQIAMIAGTLTSLDWVVIDLWLWTPSSIGSVGFVAASALYLHEARPAADIGTISATANLLGSMCFLIGSVAGYLAQGPIQIPGNDFANPVFLAGSVLFLFGSWLALVELRTPLQAHQSANVPPTILNQ